MDAHRAFNKAIVEKLVKASAAMPQFKDYLFVMDSVDLKGPAITKSGWWDATTADQELTPLEWIVEGGYSADEPEIPAAYRHFYDPLALNGGKSYLTDMNRALAVFNPQVDAIFWHFYGNDPNGINEWTWENGKKYLLQALRTADEAERSALLGKAFRCLGEVLHNTADMGCPPHVRNDGHALNDADPLEYATNAAEVRANFSSNWSTAVNYAQSVCGLMNELASWTNRNFFSKDTIPMAGRTTTANGQPAYPLRDMNALTVSRSGYIESFVDGAYVRQARQSVWYRMGLTKTPSYTMDSVVITDQQRVLIPTAVRATEAVIERFLPRFKVTASVKPAEEGKYTVFGEIELQPSAEWPERLPIRNGAYVRIGNKKEPVKLYAAEDLNEFSTTAKASVGDEIVVGYDLGGYVIESDPVEIQDIPARQTIEATYELTGMEFPPPGRVFGTADNPITVSIGGTVRTAPGIQFERAEWYSFVSGWPPVVRFVFSIPAVHQPDGTVKTEYNDLDVVSLGVSLGEPKNTKVEKDELGYPITYEFLGCGDGEAFSMPLFTTSKRYSWSNGGSISNVPHFTRAVRDDPIKEFKGPLEVGGAFATNFRIRVTTKDVGTGEETSGVQEVGIVLVLSLVQRIVEP